MERTERKDRRMADRFPIEREVRYRALTKRNIDEVGEGTTLNISSNGILFTADRELPPGRRLEISVSWPVALNGTIGLKLVARGKVIWCANGKTAFEIQQYEFRTNGSRPLQQAS
jgi:hypothetical protein